MKWGSVPFSVQEIGDGLPCQAPRHHALARSFPSSMVRWRSHGHRCVPSGDSTPMIPQPTFTENGTAPVFFTNTSAALNSEFSSILRAENPVKPSMARYVTPQRVSFLLRQQGVRKLLFNRRLSEVRRFWSTYYLIPKPGCCRPECPSSRWLEG